ncbi:hypothetical protein BDF19DRAFT_496863 [Syncephalis fuscata]|nr:hypothetical protein BDF19DRAFT_496863 [Syncephalis fuscata]
MMEQQNSTATMSLKNDSDKVALSVALPSPPQQQPQQESHTEPLSLLERRISGRNGSPGVTFVNKRIVSVSKGEWKCKCRSHNRHDDELQWTNTCFMDTVELTRGLTLPDARAPRTPYPAKLPLTPVSGGTPTAEQGILDEAGAALNSTAAISSNNINSSNNNTNNNKKLNNTSPLAASSATATAATPNTDNASTVLPRRNRNSTRFGWVTDWRRIIGVTSIAAVMLAMVITSVKIS